MHSVCIAPGVVMSQTTYSFPLMTTSHCLKKKREGARILLWLFLCIITIIIMIQQPLYKSTTQDYMLGQLHCLSVQPDHPAAYWCVWRSDWGCGTAQSRSHSPVFCACPEGLTLAPQQDVWCCTQSTSALF